MTTSTETAHETTTAGGLSDRIRNQWALAQTRFGEIEQRAKAQWVALPGDLRAAVDRLVERLIRRLDLPTRADLTALSDRIDELHRKLAAVETARAGGTPRPSVPEAAATPAAAPAGDADHASESELRVRAETVANKTSRRKHK